MENNITTLDYQGKKIVLIGTAHVSRESVFLVKKTIDTISPDTVCIELDEARYKNLKDPKAWERTNVVDIIKSKKVGLLLANLILSSYQKNIAKRLNTIPGQEMIQGIESAKEHDCDLVLADRDIQITFLRIWRKLSLWNKCKLVAGLIFNFQENDCIGEDDLKVLMEKDNLEASILSIAKDFPQFAEVLIYERDQHLAYKIKTAPGCNIVAVLGAAHVAGVTKEIFRQQDLANITALPKSYGISKIISWLIPIAVLLLIGYGFLTNFQIGMNQLTTWLLWNSILAALFTTLVLGHPVSILTAFITAPFTTLHPFLACGWFAGIAEATVRKPTVEDVNNVVDDIFHLKRFFQNRFLKSLAIVIFANMGCAIGTVVAGTSIINSMF